jgi:hypothetical protein
VKRDGVNSATNATQSLAISWPHSLALAKYIDLLPSLGASLFSLPTLLRSSWPFVTPSLATFILFEHSLIPFIDNSPGWLLFTLDNNNNLFRIDFDHNLCQKTPASAIPLTTFFTRNLENQANFKMSARMIQLGLMSLVSSAIAIPVYSYDDASSKGEFKAPSGTGFAHPSGKAFGTGMAYGTGVAHGTGRKHHGARPRPSSSGSYTMEAISTAVVTAAAGVDTAVAVNAVAGTSTDCETETFYTTTTNFITVYATASPVVDSASVDSTIYASSVVPSSAAAAVVPVASSSVAAYSAPAVVSPVASSSVAQAIGKFTYSKTAVVAASSTSTPVAAVVASSSVVVPVAAAPATSTKATTTAAATSTSTASSTGNKRGIAYNSVSLAKLLIGKSQWAYNWGSSNGGLASGVEYLPMLWSASTDKTNTWVSDAKAGIAAGATALLGFNEPDHTEQANMSPQAAATAYKTYITDNFVGKAKLISPAVTNGGGTMGLTWLSSFMSLCSDCKIDAVAIHWYDLSTNTDYFKSHIQDAHTQSGLPVYLTEFGTTDGNDQAFLAEVLPWLDAQDYVQRYAYFMAEDGKLISGTSLSAAGNTYCS